MKKIIILLFIFLTLPLTAQELDIVPYLKAVEEGKREIVAAELPSLKQKYKNDPSFIFLEGVLSEKADEAMVLYNRIVDKYPDSKYADAALYRIYSYYFAMGLYKTAENQLNKLKSKYPSSPYIKIADRDIPDQDEISAVVNNVESTPEHVEINSDQNKKFTIQAGAFSDKKNSEQLVNELRSAGYRSEIKDKLVAGTVFHVVYVGRFSNKTEAGSFLKVINDQYNLDGRIIDLDAE
jgi:tetratricopeptide (TPR) repeat protein